MNIRNRQPALRRRHLAASLVMALGIADGAHAATYNVQDCSDGTSTQTLRHLLSNAVDGDIVQINADVCSHISLSQPSAIMIESNVTLQGSGANQITITGGADATPPVEHAIFYHTGSGTFSITGVTLRDANNLNSNVASGGCVYSKGNLDIEYSVLANCVVDVAQNKGGVFGFPKGGAAYAAGSITLVHSTVTGSRVQGPSGSSTAGGGIFARNNADIEYSTISNNQSLGPFSDGGGVYAAGVFQMRHSTVSGNYAPAGGGLDLFATADATISYSTISGNQAGTDSALRIEANFTPSPYKVTFINSTISDNRAQYETIYTDMPTVVRNSTIAFNHAVYTETAAGLYTKASLTAFSSIFANNENYDVKVGSSQGATISGSGNLINQTQASVPNGTLASCAKLEALEAAGGDTQTLALQSDSPALNHGNLIGGFLGFDQRSEPRNVGGVDIGAYERQTNAPADDRIFLSAFAGPCN